MHSWKGIAVAAVLYLVFGWPAAAEANGEHFHVGAIHFDPVVGGAIAVFVGLITLMFVGQWIRFNAARRSGAGTTDRKSADHGEEDTEDNGQEDDRGQQEP